MILKKFDVRKQKEMCNEKDCGYRPTKKVEIYQYEMKKGKKILATLHVCDAHFRDVVKIVETIKEENPRVIIDKDITDL